MLETSFNPEDLKSRFNPEGSLLRRQQNRMTELLIEIDRICKKHSIQYWLSSGTLLGAVRHKGFIPWDDDMDIEMLRPDYERLMKVLPEELPETMALQSHNTDKNYFFFYAKVRDRRSLMEESNHYDRVFKEKGIFVDIFPFEKQPLWVHRISELAQGHVYKIMNRKEGNELVAMRKVRFITSMNEKIIFPILGLFCKLSNARETYGLGIPYHDPRHLEDILPLTTTEFEGRLFPVPKDCDKVLTLKYGDYMCLPDVSNISLHVGKLVIDN
ncbi:MAG: LicD family protein [Bacteroidaceae bacterium]|jgi:lipopolysaccharide cholinephosphotransferase|nr:LicD family protein [Bacteroidaceae bacterium]